MAIIRIINSKAKTENNTGFGTNANDYGGKTVLDLDKLNTTGNLSIKEYKNGNYIGIEIDKNNRFVINDFTVTHNCANIFSTKFIVNIDDFKRKKRWLFR